jgi:RNA polymerase sigma-70 factor (ECF subfamily)
MSSQEEFGHSESAGNPAEKTPSGETSDDALIARAKTGDFDAFESLISRYQEKVYRLAFRFVRNEAEAKEIVQDTLLSVWRKLDGFKGDSQFGSWLFRVTTNAALMRLRSQRRHPETSTEDLPPGYLDVPASYGHVTSFGENWSKRPDDELQSDELRKQIQAAVDDLPEIYRTVFLVRDVDGLSTEETAEALQLSIPTVKTRLHRARMALRAAIGSHFGRAGS